MARTASKKVGLPRNHEDSQQEDFSRLSDRSARIFLRGGLDSILRYNVYISLRGEKNEKREHIQHGERSSLCFGGILLYRPGHICPFRGLRRVYGKAVIFRTPAALPVRCRVSDARIFILETLRSETGLQL